MNRNQGELWPSFIDGEGRLHDVFPWKNEYSHPRYLITSHRSYDCGLLYQLWSEDLNGDGLDEALIFNRHNIWIFSSPEGEGLGS